MASPKSLEQAVELARKFQSATSVADRHKALRHLFDAVGIPVRRINEKASYNLHRNEPDFEQRMQELFEQAKTAADKHYGGSGLIEKGLAGAPAKSGVPEPAGSPRRAPVDSGRPVIPEPDNLINDGRTAQLLTSRIHSPEGEKYLETLEDALRVSGDWPDTPAKAHAFETIPWKQKLYDPGQSVSPGGPTEREVLDESTRNYLNSKRRELRKQFPGISNAELEERVLEFDPRRAGYPQPYRPNSVVDPINSAWWGQNVERGPKELKKALSKAYPELRVDAPDMSKLSRSDLPVGREVQLGKFAVKPRSISPGHVDLEKKKLLGQVLRLGRGRKSPRQIAQIEALVDTWAEALRVGIPATRVLDLVNSVPPNQVFGGGVQHGDVDVVRNTRPFENKIREHVSLQRAMDQFRRALELPPDALVDLQQLSNALASRARSVSVGNTPISAPSGNKLLLDALSGKSAKPYFEGFRNEWERDALPYFEGFRNEWERDAFQKLLELGYSPNAPTEVDLGMGLGPEASSAFSREGLPTDTPITKQGREGIALERAAVQRAVDDFKGQRSLRDLSRGITESYNDIPIELRGAELPGGGSAAELFGDLDNIKINPSDTLRSANPSVEKYNRARGSLLNVLGSKMDILDQISGIPKPDRLNEKPWQVFADESGQHLYDISDFDRELARLNAERLARKESFRPEFSENAFLRDLESGLQAQRRADSMGFQSQADDVRELLEPHGILQGGPVPEPYGPHFKANTSTEPHGTDLEWFNRMAGRSGPEIPSPAVPPANLDEETAFRKLGEQLRTPAMGIYPEDENFYFKPKEGAFHGETFGPAVDETGEMILTPQGPRMGGTARDILPGGAGPLRSPPTVDVPGSSPLSELGDALRTGRVAQDPVYGRFSTPPSRPRTGEISTARHVASLGDLPVNAGSYGAAFSPSIRETFQQPGTGEPELLRAFAESSSANKALPPTVESMRESLERVLREGSGAGGSMFYGGGPPKMGAVKAASPKLRPRGGSLGAMGLLAGAGLIPALAYYLSQPTDLGLTLAGATLGVNPNLERISEAREIGRRLGLASKKDTWLNFFAGIPFDAAASFATTGV